jgi:hypothetical protein
MVFSENRFTLFRIMRWQYRHRDLRNCANAFSVISDT